MQRVLSALCGLIAVVLLVDYAAQTSRELNQEDADDRAFLGGRSRRRNS